MQKRFNKKPRKKKARIDQLWNLKNGVMTRGLIIGVCELDPLEGNSMAGIPRKRGEGVWEAGVGAKVVRLPRKGTRKP